MADQMRMVFTVELGIAELADLRMALVVAQRELGNRWKEMDGLLTKLDASTLPYKLVAVEG